MSDIFWAFLLKRIKKTRNEILLFKSINLEKNKID